MSVCDVSKDYGKTKFLKDSSVDNMYLWNAMPPAATKSQKAIFSVKVKVK